MMLFRAGAQPVRPAATAPAVIGRMIQEPNKARDVHDLDVLLLDAENRQSLAAMRAYARAGLTVGAAACESEAWWAPSFRSRWCSLRATLPELTTDAEGYVKGLLTLLDEHPARMVLPGYDGSIQALRTRRADFERRTALPLASEPALTIAVTKTRTLAPAAHLAIAAPPSLPVS